jgi:hypothetical protein
MTSEALALALFLLLLFAAKTGSVGSRALLALPNLLPSLEAAQLELSQLVQPPPPGPDLLPESPALHTPLSSAPPRAAMKSASLAPPRRSPDLLYALFLPASLATPL